MATLPQERMVTGLFIHNSYNFNFAHRNRQLHSSKLLVAVQRLSSGYRINSAKDDPVGLAISERMRAQLTQMRGSIRNSRLELDQLAVAEGSLEEASDMMRRLKELAVQAASDTMSDDEREALQKEAEALIEETKRITNATRFNGQSLLNSEGDKPKSSLQTGLDTASLEKAKTAMPQLSLLEEILKDFNISTREGAQQSLALADNAVQAVSGMRASLGAKAAQLEKNISAQEEAEDRLTEAESRIRDADMAKEMMTYAKEQFLEQAAQIAMVHAIREPERVLELLKTGTD